MAQLMAALPYMKLFVGDYFADTRHLTCLQHGAYLQLLMSYWKRGEALPNDDRVLAKLVGLGPRQWARIKHEIIAFFRVEGPSLVHSRLEKELCAASDKSLKSKNARATGVERALSGRSTRHSHSHSHSTEPSVPSIGFNKLNPQRAPAALASDDLFGEAPAGAGEHQGELGPQYTSPFETWWAEYPKKVGKGSAAKSYQAAFKKVGGKEKGTDRVHAWLLHSLKAQVLIWKRKGTKTQFIPFASTWLNSGRYDDADVQAFRKAREQLIEDAPQPSVAPAVAEDYDPFHGKRKRIKIPGWDDET